MFNIIKADVVRLLKSKSFWITLGAYALLFVFVIYMQNIANGELINTNEIGSGRNEGFYIAVDIIVKSLNAFVTTFGFQFGALFLGIYMASFVCNEYSTGYVKNIATLNGGRKAIVLSKLAVASVITVLIFVVCYFLSFIAGNILIEDFTIEPFDQIIKSIGTMFILSMAIFSLIIFVSALFKNKVAGIVTVCLVSSGMLTPFINSLFELLHISFLSEYTLSHFSMVFDSLEKGMLLKMLGMCIVYILVYNVLSIFIVSKRDL